MFTTGNTFINDELKFDSDNELCTEITLYYDDLTLNEQVKVTGLNIGTTCDSVNTNLFKRKRW